MKVIDLLDKIANGEEVPKKIQVYSDIFVLDDDNMLYKNEKTGTNLLRIYNGYILNYEAAIIEEDKKIRGIKVEYSSDIEEKIFYEDGDKPRHYVLGDAGTELLINKINEIIDKINNMEVK